MGESRHHDRVGTLLLRALIDYGGIIDVEVFLGLYMSSLKSRLKFTSQSQRQSVIYITAKQFVSYVKTITQTRQQYNTTSISFSSVTINLSRRLIYTAREFQPYLCLRNPVQLG